MHNKHFLIIRCTYMHVCMYKSTAHALGVQGCNDDITLLSPVKLLFHSQERLKEENTPGPDITHVHVAHILPQYYYALSNCCLYSCRIPLIMPNCRFVCKLSNWLDMLPHINHTYTRMYICIDFGNEGSRYGILKGYTSTAIHPNL